VFVLAQIHELTVAQIFSGAGMRVLRNLLNGTPAQEARPSGSYK
jgi:hypothetical protein